MSTNWLSGISGGSGVFRSSASGRSAAANGALGAGVTYLQTKQYDLALRAFQQALAYSPTSSRPSYLMARTYLAMDRTDEAISAYRRAIRTDPNDGTSRFELASLYQSLDRTDEALKELEQIVKLDPNSLDGRTSLGFAYMQAGRVDEAAVQFDKATRTAPRSALAHYGMGLARGRQGETTTSIRELERAVELDPMYALARSELAMAYLRTGREDLAEEQETALQELGTGEGFRLAQQVRQVMFTPKIAYLDVGASTFQVTGLQNTPLSDIDARLAAPGASVMFRISFVFNQAMDLASVQNVNNWSISRASGGQAGVYNNGANLTPEKDAALLPIPSAVRYDPLTQRATLYFPLTQNATGDAVIDPRHIVFQFKGVDARGVRIDPKGDQFNGWVMRRF